MSETTPSLTVAQRAALDLERDIAVTAGPGSGKTRILTERFLAALDRVRSRPAPLRRVVALTFTDKAAAEMRTRVRAGVGERLREAARAGDGAGVRWWRQVRSELQALRISTIHTFCATLLRDLPLEAAIDPDLVVADAIETRLLAREAVRAYLVEIAKRSPETDADASALERVLRSYRPAELRGVLSKLLEDREVAELWLPGVDPDVDTRLRSVREELRLRLETVGRRLVRRVRREELETIRRAGAKGIHDPLGDTARAIAPLVAAVLDGVVGPEPLVAAREALAKSDGEPRSFGRTGRRENWGVAIDGLRGAIAGLARAVVEETEWFEPVDPERERLAWEIERDAAVLYAGARSRYERLLGSGRRTDFAGLELLALRLLDRPGVASRVQAEVDYLLVDEFQDTNHVQWSILERLLGGDRAPNFFVVGDEKQAIYEFRGGRVELFRRAAERIGRAGGKVVPLGENFRTLPDPLRFVNEVFLRIFEEDPDREYEAAPQALVQRRAAAEPAAPRRVELLLGADDEERDAEADRIAERVHAWVARRTEIHDPETNALRPVGWADVAVLVFYRRSLASLEAAFAARGVPTAVIGGRGFFQSVEVADVLDLLHVLTDLRDEIALAALLRSPFFSLSDPLLWRIATARGRDFVDRFRRADPRETAADDGDAGRLAAAQRRIADWRHACGRVPSSALINRALDESGYRAIAGAAPRGVRHVANLERLVEIVRGFEAVHGIRPSRLVAWLEAQVEAVEDEMEAPEPDAPEGVNLMTIHQAKGTEYPIVAVAGLAEPPKAGETIPLLVFHDARRARVALKVPGDRDELVKTARFRYLEGERRDRERAEQKRVLYVAMTRARDVLLLSARRSPARRSAKSGAPALQWIRRHPALEALLASDAAPDALEVGGTTVAVAAGPPPPRPRLEPDLRLVTEVERLLAEVPAAAAPPVARPPADERPRLWPVTALSTLAVCPRRFFYRHVVGLPERPAWAQPRSDGGGRPAGTAGEAARRGQEIHRALARFGATGLDPRVVSEDVRADVERFLVSRRAVEIASAGGGRTEIEFVLPTPAGTIDGTIDRIYRGPDGTWTVVDYKSGAVPDASRVVRIAAGRGYDVQLSLYACSVAQLEALAPTDRVRTVLFFTATGDERVVERDVASLPDPVDLAPALEALAERSLGGGSGDFPRQRDRTDGSDADLLRWTDRADEAEPGPICERCPYFRSPCRR
jgi:ATP-dependent helicase/nuclease subunit A